MKQFVKNIINGITACSFLFLANTLSAQQGNDVIWDDEWYQSLEQWSNTGRPNLRDTSNGIFYSDYYPQSYTQLRNPICLAIALADTYTAFEGIHNNLISAKQYTTDMRFSPWFIFVMGNGDCKEGLHVRYAAEAIDSFGICRHTTFKTYCSDLVLPSKKAFAEANNHRSKVNSLFGLYDSDKVTKTKNYLRMVGPLVACFAAKAPNCEQIEDSIWQPTAFPKEKLYPGHAMSVVGFRNGKFKLLNSSGTSCGERGYLWISYQQFERFARYGLYFETNGARISQYENNFRYEGFNGKLNFVYPPDFFVSIDNSSRCFYKKKLPSGQQFSLKATVASGNCAYLFEYIPAISKTTLLWSTIWADNDTIHIYTPKYGLNSPQKYYFLLHSMHPIPDIEKRLAIFDELAEQESEVIAYLQKAFAPFLSVKSCIDYELYRMEFKMKCSRGSGMIVPLILYLEAY